MAKTNTGLVEYAKAQLGKPYWYGTFGNIGTKELHQKKDLKIMILRRELNTKIHLRARFI
jgi:hypothetical protein